MPSHPACTGHWRPSPPGLNSRPPGKGGFLRSRGQTILRHMVAVRSSSHRRTHSGLHTLNRQRQRAAEAEVIQTEILTGPGMMLRGQLRALGSRTLTTTYRIYHFNLGFARTASTIEWPRVIHKEPRPHHPGPEMKLLNCYKGSNYFENLFHK